VTGTGVRPRLRVRLVKQVIEPRRLLVDEDALRRRALVALPVVRVPWPRDRAELGLRRRERDARRQQCLLLKPPVCHHGWLGQTAQIAKH
jgi:hypothetical protein